MRIQHFTTAVFLGMALVSFSARTSAQQGTATGVPVQMIVSVEAKHGEEVPPINRHDIIVHQGQERPAGYRLGSSHGQLRWAGTGDFDRR
jgi:hypothetical protein